MVTDQISLHLKSPFPPNCTDFLRSNGCKGWLTVTRTTSGQSSEGAMTETTAASYVINKPLRLEIDGSRNETRGSNVAATTTASPASLVVLAADGLSASSALPVKQTNDRPRWTIAAHSGSAITHQPSLRSSAASPPCWTTSARTPRSTCSPCKRTDRARAVCPLPT